MEKKKFTSEKIINRNYFNLKTEISDNEKILFDFISNKNKIKLKSCFDKKGTKKFLSEKEKAMAEITLFDEILEAKKVHKKSHHHHHKKKSKNHHVRSVSENAIFRLKPKNNFKKLSDKHLEKNKKIESNKYVNKSKIKNKSNIKIIRYSITSVYSKINANESLTLASKNNDSFINSIVTEMTNNKKLT